MSCYRDRCRCRNLSLSWRDRQGKWSCRKTCQISVGCKTTKRLCRRKWVELKYRTVMWGRLLHPWEFRSFSVFPLVFLSLPIIISRRSWKKKSESTPFWTTHYLSSLCWVGFCNHDQSRMDVYEWHWPCILYPWPSCVSCTLVSLGSQKLVSVWHSLLGKVHATMTRACADYTLFVWNEDIVRKYSRQSDMI